VPGTGEVGKVLFRYLHGGSERSVRSQVLPQLSASIPESKHSCIQNSLLYKNEILVLSFSWINSVAPFFFFNLDDFEKSVLKYTHIAAGL